MSYSVSAQGATKAEAIANIGKSLDEVLESQEYHKDDIEQAKAAATAFIGVLPDSVSGESFSVSVGGSLSWQGDLENPRFTGASVSIYACLVKA